MVTDYVKRARVHGRVVLCDVTVIDVVGATRLPHRDVVVEDGRIVGVEPGGAGDGVRVDASGMFVVPGYVDAHVHVLNHVEAAPASYALMLTNGITGFRQMSGSDSLLAGRQTLPAPPGAPRLLALCGDLLTPLNAGSGEDAREAVRHQAAAGADFVKAAMAPREGFMAAAAECARLGIPLAGHLPADLTAADAAAARVRCVEHLGPGKPLFEGASACCGETTEKHRRTVHVPAWARPIASAVADRLIDRIVVNPAALTSSDAAEQLAKADETFSEDDARAMAAMFREAGVWQCPTLIRLRTQQTPGLFAADERLRYVDPAARATWDASLRRFLKRPAATRDVLARHLSAQSRLLKTFVDNGVHVLTGTDANGAGWVVPGFALHEEFDLMAEAGLSPAQVLRATTASAAEFFERSSAGQVRPGFDADLVLLRSDPLESVRALHDIAGVMRDGQYWSRPELDEILARCEAAPAAR